MYTKVFSLIYFVIYYYLNYVKTFNNYLQLDVIRDSSLVCRLNRFTHLF